MAIRVARRNGRSAWVNIVESESAEHEDALLIELKKAKEALDETEPVEESVFAAVQDLEEHIEGNYEGEVVLATIDYVLQYLYDKFVVHVRQSDVMDLPDEFVRFGEYGELWMADEDGEPYTTNWNNVQSMLRTFPCSFVPLKTDSIPFGNDESTDQCKRTWKRMGDGEVMTVEAIHHEDWCGMSNPCPECGSTELNHFNTQGGQYGLNQDDHPVLRTDYDSHSHALLTVCKSCGEVLFKHPAADLILDWKDVTNSITLI